MPKAIKPLLSVADYATLMNLTPAAIYLQLLQDRCAIQPIVGLKPRKWRRVEVEAFLAVTNG